MQMFFSNIENTLYDWFLLISNNSLYSAILAAAIGIILSGVIVGLIMSAQFRAKNDQLRMSLNDKETGGGQGDEAIVEDLGEAKQLIQNLKVELIDKDSLVGEMEKDMQNIQVQAEHTIELEEHINHRNEQIFQIVDTLETDFDLGESRERPSVDDVWAEALWQRHNQLMTHLQNRLRTNNLPQDKQNDGQNNEDFAKKEVIIAELTQTMETQSNHITKLEHELEAQKQAMQESLLKAQAYSTEIEEKTLARISELEKELHEARKSAVEKVVVIVQKIPQQIITGFDEIALKPFIEQIAHIKQNASLQSQQAIETINHHVIEPAVNTYHTFSENLIELPELSLKALQRQSEEMKKSLLRIKEQFYDSGTVGEAVAAVKHRITPSNLHPTAEV